MEFVEGKGSLPLIIIEEIALEGLDGITIEGLWKRLSPVLKIKLPFLENFQIQIWSFVKKSKSILQFYELPKPREKLKIFNRRDLCDPDLGEFIMPDECPFTRYPYKLIEDGDIKGSCEFYKERKNISFDEIKDMALDAVIERWGDKFVIVANQHVREHYLIPETTQFWKELTMTQYGFLEVIGRSRYNGETTCGKHSITYICQESHSLHYIKLKLIEYKYIEKQYYYEKLGNRSTSGQLLTLPRFFTEYKTRSINIIESLFKAIKATGTINFLPTANFRETFPFEYSNPLKKIRQNCIFKKFFNIDKRSHRELYPDRDESEHMQKNKTKEKFIVGYSLKNPNMILEDLWLDDDVKEENKLDFFNCKDYLVDMPKYNQIFKYIDDHGIDGVSNYEMLRNLGMYRYIIRAVLNQLTKDGLITTFMKDFGRQRTYMFISVKNAKLKSEMEKNAESKSPILQTEVAASTAAAVSPEKTILETTLEDSTMISNESIDNTKLSKSKIASDESPQKSDESLQISSNELMPSRKMNLEKFGEEDIHSIEAIIKEISELPYKIDKKFYTKLSLRQKERLKTIKSIVSEKKLIDFHILYKILRDNEKKQGCKEEICRKSLKRLICYLKHENNYKYYEVILKKGNYARIYKYITLSNILSNEDVFQNEMVKCKTTFHLSILDKQQRQRKSMLHYMKMQANSKMKSKTNKVKIADIQIPKEKPKTPKFLRAQCYHELLIYMAYEQCRNVNPIPLTEEIISKWQDECTITLDMNELRKEIPKLYSEQISWKMFIPPVVQGKEISKAWIALQDIVPRLPLSLIIRSNWIEHIPGSLIESYINHPIRQHYLAQNIPELSTYLMEQKINFNQYENAVRLLANMGLIQMAERDFKQLKCTWIYINRYGKILDTSSSEPGYNITSKNRIYPEKIFTFNNVVDVMDYWTNLHKIIVNTKLGARGDASTKNRKILHQRQLNIELVKFFEAPENDIGYLPGDNSGAAGLDTLLYAHVKKNWSWSLKNREKTTVTKPKTTANLTKLKKMKKKDVGKLRTPKVILLEGKKVIVKKRSSKKCKPTPPKTGRIRQEYDDIDKEALKRMKSLRVQWSPEEDRILKICRAVFLYLDDPMISRVIQFYTVRDVIQWAISSLNKTARACHRRLLFLTRFKRDLPDTAVWLHELKQNQYITKLYGERFLTDLRKIYPFEKEFASALRIHFIKLVSYLFKIVNYSSQNEIILPDTLNQFNMLYECTTNSLSVENNGLKHFEPKTHDEIEIYTINNLIHSSLCSFKDKTLYNIQLFDIYKGYNENILAQAFNKARNDRLVVASKFKQIQSHQIIPVGPTIVLSVKYRQAHYTPIPYTVVEELYGAFKNYLANNTIKGNSFDFSSVNAGTCIFLAELLLQQNIILDIQLPQRILTIDPHQEKSKDSERILEHFHRLFENAPKTEYTKHFEDKYKTSSAQLPKIRFNSINESYKMPYNPFEVLAKLNDDYIHFFCLLNNLYNEVDLNMDSWTTEQRLCPFNCLLNSVNFINSIERIISERQSIIELLPIASNNYDESMDTSTIVITEENIIAIFNKILNIIKCRSKEFQTKHLGKICTQCHKVNVVLLAKDLLEYFDQDFVCLDGGEYMPISSKEDKIIKAQDIFVVNLPKVKVPYDCVPKNLGDLQYSKEEILDKIRREYIFSPVKYNIDDVVEFMSTDGYSINDIDFIKQLVEFVEQQKLGVSGTELLEYFYNEQLLIESISILRKYSLVIRVGVEHYKYVHKNNMQPWIVNTYHIKRLEKESLNSNGKNMSMDEPVHKKRKNDNDPCTSNAANANDTKELISSSTRADIHKQREKIIMRPCPWIRINGSLNRRVLDKWMGTILLGCLDRNGLTALDLCVRFKLLHPTNILFLLEILQDIGCVSLKCKKINKITLLSSYEDPLISDVNEFTDKKNLFIIVKPDAITKLSFFIGDKQYKYDFI